MKLFLRLHKRNSGEVAKKRLRNVLSADRTDCSPEVIEMVKEDLVVTVSKYMEVDQGGIEIQIRQEDTANGRKKPALYANIPILNMGNKGIF